ncbi:hypothetical protein, partial [Rhizobium leguminosarum]|uniref:hypothetical protein n=1 Tax=Rhizobium leguminosarum TaxID=384 RepID=UPI003F996F34
MRYSLFYVSREKTHCTEKCVVSSVIHVTHFSSFFHEACGLAGERKTGAAGEASILECGHRQFDVNPSRGSCFA